MKLIIYVILCLCIISCSNTETASYSSGSNHSIFTLDSTDVFDDNFEHLNLLEIESIDLYCFCFSDSIWKSCNTVVRVSPDALIKTKNLIGSISNEKGTNTFINLLHTNYRIIDTIQGMDVRLVATINTKNNGQKTLSYYTDSVLCYQDKYLVQYNKKVTTIFREAFNLSAIHCE